MDHHSSARTCPAKSLVHLNLLFKTSKLSNLAEKQSSMWKYQNVLIINFEIVLNFFFRNRHGGQTGKFLAQFTHPRKSTPRTEFHSRDP